jgi:hypothetical protein
MTGSGVVQFEESLVCPEVSDREKRCCFDTGKIKNESPDGMNVRIFEYFN